MSEKIQHTLTLPENVAGMRLDQALSSLFPDYSRTQIQEWIKNGEITLNDLVPKNKEIVLGGETVVINGTVKQPHTWHAEDIALNIVYEDDAIIVIYKPAGMVVHPAAGNFTSTLLNALLHHAPELQKLPRAGIVHRLDKDTSGLLVIAKTQPALLSLTKQLKARTFERIYQTVVNGLFISGGTVDAPIGRHPMQRLKMAIIDSGKPAITHFRVVEKYRGHTRLKVKLDTGRTHQIRLHMAHIKHPVLGDQTYGGRLQLPKNATPALVDKLREFKRQALHASELGIIHPVTQQPMSWRAPLPEDMQKLIECLRNDTPSYED
jgi:23S rRNA pseudouridine1911/1915/1917 synthase